MYHASFVDRDGIIGIVTCYRLFGLGIESRLGQDFLQPSIPAMGLTQPPIQWVLGISRGVKQSGHGVDPPPASSAEIKESVELYLYSGLSWPVLAWTLALPLPCIFHYFFMTNKCIINVTKVYITTVSLYVIHTPTCFEISTSSSGSSASVTC
jgi:hypothetical protein